MFKRLLSTVLVACFVATVAHAALRSPQVPVTGTALATFFAAQGQTINANTQQLDLQVLSVPPTTNFEVRTFGPQLATSSLGVYNSTPVSPPLYQIVPGDLSSAGWFAVAAFRTGPARLVVNLFDPSTSPQGTSSYLGADPTGFGFFAQDAGGTTFFMQDSRNAGGSARILAFNGTGARAGWTWLACEMGAGPGGDFADYIGLAQLQLAPVPVHHTNWSRIKRLFR